MGAKLVKFVGDVEGIIEETINSDEVYAADFSEKLKSTASDDALAIKLLDDLKDKKKLGKKFLPLLSKVNRDKFEKKTLDDCLDEACHMNIAKRRNVPYKKNRIWDKFLLHVSTMTADEMRNFISLRIATMSAVEVRQLILKTEDHATFNSYPSASPTTIPVRDSPKSAGKPQSPAEHTRSGSTPVSGLTAALKAAKLLPSNPISLENDSHAIRYRQKLESVLAISREAAQLIVKEKPLPAPKKTLKPLDSQNARYELKNVRVHVLEMSQKLPKELITVQDFTPCATSIFIEGVQLSFSTIPLCLIEYSGLRFLTLPSFSSSFNSPRFSPFTSPKRLVTSSSFTSGSEDDISHLLSSSSPTSPILPTSPTRGHSRSRAFSSSPPPPPSPLRSKSPLVSELTIRKLPWNETFSELTKTKTSGTRDSRDLVSGATPPTSATPLTSTTLANTTSLSTTSLSTTSLSTTSFASTTSLSTTSFASTISSSTTSSTSATLSTTPSPTLSTSPTPPATPPATPPKSAPSKKDSPKSASRWLKKQEDSPKSTSSSKDSSPKTSSLSLRDILKDGLEVQTGDDPPGFDDPSPSSNLKDYKFDSPPSATPTSPGTKSPVLIHISTTRLPDEPSDLSKGSTYLVDMFVDWMSSKLDPPPRSQLRAEFPTDSHIMRYLMGPTGNVVIQRRNSADPMTFNSITIVVSDTGERATYSELTTDDTDLIQLIKSPDFFRNLIEVFKSSDLKSHGMALRLLWLALTGLYNIETVRDKFYTAISTCGGEKYHPFLRNALLSILVGTNADIAKNMDTEQKIAFGMMAKHPEAWKALLYCMRSCSMQLRKDTLEDINTILYNSWTNAESLVENTPAWQSSAYALFTDVPKIRVEESVKSVYALLANVFTMVHQQFFLRSPRFLEVLKDSLKQLHTFSGYTEESCRLASTLLYSLCYKLGKEIHLLTSAKDDICWRNLVPLLQYVRWFAFGTAYWKSVTPPEAAPLQQLSFFPGLSLTSPNSSQKKARETRSRAGPATSKESDYYRRKVSELTAHIERQKTLGFVLARQRSVKEQFIDDFGTESNDVSHYGFHWNDQGSFAESSLLKAVISLLKALRVDKCEVVIESETHDQRKKLEAQLVKEYQFFTDAEKFVSTINLRAITELGILTYKKFGMYVKKFIASKSNAKDRDQIMKELTQLYMTLGKKHGFGGKPESKEKETVK